MSCRPHSPATPNRKFVRPCRCNRNTCVVPICRFDAMCQENDQIAIMWDTRPSWGRDEDVPITNLPVSMSPLHCLAANEPSRLHAGRSVTVSGKWNVYEQRALLGYRSIHIRFIRFSLNFIERIPLSRTHVPVAIWHRNPGAHRFSWSHPDDL